VRELTVKGDHIKSNLNRQDAKKKCGERVKDVFSLRSRRCERASSVVRGLFQLDVLTLNTCLDNVTAWAKMRHQDGLTQNCSSNGCVHGDLNLHLFLPPYERSVTYGMTAIALAA
jgi:hypothetical protein